MLRCPTAVPGSFDVTDGFASLIFVVAPGATLGAAGTAALTFVLAPTAISGAATAPLEVATLMVTATAAPAAHRRAERFQDVRVMSLPL